MIQEFRGYPPGVSVAFFFPCRNFRHRGLLDRVTHMPSLRQMAWYLGRGLQLLGLLVLPYSLMIGMQTSDATSELKLLMLGALQFFCGLGLVRWAGASE